MDADIVREVEFSRSLRGYNMAEVDAFLEKMEGMFRRRDLEQEAAEKKYQQELQKGEAQAQQLALLSVKLEEAQKRALDGQAELDRMQEALRRAQEALHAEEERTAALQEENAQLNAALSAARADAVQAEQRSKVLEKSLEAQPQNRLADVGTAAKGSLKKLSESLRAMRR